MSQNRHCTYQREKCTSQNRRCTSQRRRWDSPSRLCAGSRRCSLPQGCLPHVAFPVEPIAQPLAPEEVDAAFEYLTANKERYGIKQIGKPLYNHGSYSLYFVEPGTNGWEIECYAAALRKESMAQRFGGVRAPHWDQPLAPERFPGRGYVPQAFTHGTLVCSDIKENWDFYTRVLGLAVHQLNDHVIYVKHPNSKWYIVCAVRTEFKVHSPNFRNTLTLESAEAVEKAYQELSASGHDLGVKELWPLEQKGAAVASFLLRDPGTNCWEITSTN